VKGNVTSSSSVPHHEGKTGMLTSIFPDNVNRPVLPSNWFVCDPGVHNIYTIGQAKASEPGSRRKGQVAYADDEHFFEAQVPRCNIMTLKHYKRLTQQKKLSKKLEKMHENATGYGNYDKCQRQIFTSVETLLAHITQQHSKRQHIRAFWLSKIVARHNMTKKMKRQSALDQCANHIHKMIGNEGILAWGNGCWSKTQLSNVIYKHLLTKPWAKGRLFQINECNTSVKCSNCCSVDRMQNVEHKHMDGKVKKVHGMYQCRNQKCNMTWGSRDTNACNGILRCLFALMFNFSREYTYLVKRIRVNGILRAAIVPLLDPNRTNKYPKPKPLHDISATATNTFTMDIGTSYM